MTFDSSLEIHHTEVRPDWIDGNGHMNVAYYVLAFDQALDRFCAPPIDIGWDYVRRTNYSTFVLEMHVTYLREVMAGDPLAFTLQLLDSDAKRLHYFMRMYHHGQKHLVATSEQVMLHVSLASRRATPWPETAARRLADLFEQHKSLPWPEQAGHVIGLKSTAGKDTRT
jgi:acyl-CoA thioester hydrolase